MRGLEQTLAGGLLTPRVLLAASLCVSVQISRTHPETGEDVVEDARVLSLAGGLVVQIGNRVEIDPPARIAFTTLPQGLRTEPALLARVFPRQAGANDLLLAYFTRGLSSRAAVGTETCRQSGCQTVRNPW